MRNLVSIFLTCIIVTSSIGCRDEKDKSANPVAIGYPDGSPVALPGYDGLGEVRVGSVQLFLPISLGTGIWPYTVRGTYDYTASTRLGEGSDEFLAFVRTRIEEKMCDPVQEAKKFVDDGLNLISEGVDTVAVRDWSSESDTFKGRSFFRTQHETGNQTKNYRIAILLANEKVSECISWNFEIKPHETAGVGLEIVEGSDDFITIQKGFSKTWNGIGAVFHVE